MNYFSQKLNWFHKHNNQLGSFTLCWVSQIIAITPTAPSINCMRMQYRSDHRNYEHYLSSSENKARKTFTSLRDLNWVDTGAAPCGIAEIMDSNPVRAWIFFRPYFHYYLSGVHNCEDRFHIRFFNHSSWIWFSYIYGNVCACFLPACS